MDGSIDGETNQSINIDHSLLWRPRNTDRKPRGETDGWESEEERVAGDNRRARRGVIMDKATAYMRGTPIWFKQEKKRRMNSD